MEFLHQASFRARNNSGIVEADSQGTLHLEVLYGSLIMQREFRDRGLLDLKRVVDAAVQQRRLVAKPR